MGAFELYIQTPFHAFVERAPCPFYSVASIYFNFKIYKKKSMALLFKKLKYVLRTELYWCDCSNQYILVT